MPRRHCRSGRASSIRRTLPSLKHAYARRWPVAATKRLLEKTPGWTRHRLAASSLFDLGFRRIGCRSHRPMDWRVPVSRPATVRRSQSQDRPWLRDERAARRSVVTVTDHRGDSGPVIGRRFEQDHGVRHRSRASNAASATSASTSLQQVPQDDGRGGLLSRLRIVGGTPGSRPRSEQATDPVPAQLLAITRWVRAGQHVHDHTGLGRFPLVCISSARSLSIRRCSVSSLASASQGELDRHDPECRWRS